jgi:hypothetical protein
MLHRDEVISLGAPISESSAQQTSQTADPLAEKKLQLEIESHSADESPKNAMPSFSILAALT